jgi:hypothetical protein
LSTHQNYKSIEYQKCDDYLRTAVGESKLSVHEKRPFKSTSLVVTEGFEERSVGVLELFARAGIKLATVVVNRYPDKTGPNAKYHERFNRAAEKVDPGHWSEVDYDYGGLWLSEALRRITSERVILDITGISTRGLFGAFDLAANSGRNFSIAYTEAQVYWPRKSDWRKLALGLSGHRTLAEIVDEKPWLFGYDHQVALIPGHEGYDSAGSERALVGFLPFKCARLAAVLGEEDYAEFLFIAGQPKLAKNYWRLEALKRINEDIVGGREVITIPTFGYRRVLAELARQLFVERPLLERYNVHLAILGSKLQTLACWCLSCIVPSVTIVTSAPARYFPEAFSDGIGTKSIFPLARPGT